MVEEDWLLEGVVVREAGDGSAPILKGVSTAFRAGRITLLLGRNGAGKSTLLETMAGLRKPSEGHVALGSRLLWERPKPDRGVLLATGVSLQTSASQWFAKTVEEELRYSLRPYRLSRTEEDARIAAALAAAGLPSGLPTRDPLTLSGGQQRRLAWACLLAAQPAWLLLDEPTAGLDAEGIRGLCAGLAAHKAAGRGAVVATHDPDALWPLADAVVVLDDGRVREAAAAAAWAERAARAPGAARGLPAPPLAVATAAALRAAGFALPRAAAAAAAAAEAPAPAAVAAALAAQVRAAQAAAAGAAPAAIQPPGRAEWCAAADAAPDGRSASASASDLPSEDDSQAAPAAPSSAAAADQADDPAADQAAGARPFVSASAAAIEPAACSPSRNGAGPPAGADNGISAVRRKGAAHPWAERDPRALWAAYLMLAAALLAQTGWPGAAAGIAVAAAVLWPVRKLLYPARGAIRFYLTFTVVMIGFASLSWSPLALSADRLFESSRKLGLIAAVMVLAIPLMELISPFRLRRAIEQGLGPLQRLGLPVRTIALSVSLLVRFIPMLGREWARFAGIAVVRGKRSVRPGAVPLRGVHTVLVPFLLAVLRLGDRIAFALEMRGFGAAPSNAALAEKLRFSRQDAVFLAAAAGIALLLLGMDRLPRFMN